MTGVRLKEPSRGQAKRVLLSKLLGKLWRPLGEGKAAPPFSINLVPVGKERSAERELCQDGLSQSVRSPSSPKPPIGG